MDGDRDLTADSPQKSGRFHTILNRLVHPHRS